MTNVKSISRTVLVDAALLTAACLIPTLSHLLAFPLYKLNPMLMVVMGGMLLVDNRWNAYALALLVPWVTCLVAGMPTVGGAFCITLEFVTVVTVVALAMGQIRRSSFVSLFLLSLAAVMAGKMVYYLAKWLIVRPEQLITTSPLWQMVSVMVITALFALIVSKKSK